MHELAFRCDASKYHKIGTGHVYRSLAIAEALSNKYKIPKKKIIFVCKKNNLFFKTKKIINSKKFKVLHFTKNNEISFLKKLKSKNIIFDRIKVEKKELISVSKKKFKKVIFLDSLNNSIQDCLRINSLIHKKNIKYTGFKYLITPLVNEKFNKKITYKKKIFINLGGIKKNLTYKIYEKLKNINTFKFCIPEDTKLSGKNIDYYNSKNFYKKLRQSEIIICSGGLIFFDSIFLKKKILVFPKDKHQKNNLLNVNRLHKVKIPFIKNIKNTKKLFLKMYEKDSNLKIFNLQNMKLTLKLIYKYLYK